MFSTCERLVAEIESYAREVDDRGEPLDKIKDKEKYHRLDALRYIVSFLRASAEIGIAPVARLKASEPATVGREVYDEDERPKSRALRRIL